MNSFKKVKRYSDIPVYDEYTDGKSIVEYYTQFENSTVPFINYVKKHNTINIEEVVGTFVSVVAQDMIIVLNELCGSDRFKYNWSISNGYNSLGVKNAYMIDSETETSYYLG